MRQYQRCINCVMDTTDPEIEFDHEGVCNHCRHAKEVGKRIWFPNEQGQRKLELIIQKIKSEGEGKRYDAIVGLSGGVDSSYLVYKAKEWGLRLLAVHVDAGWNNKIAEENVQAICKDGNIDLEIVKINWEDMRELQLSFLKAAVPNQDIPQDHAFFATLYTYAVKNNIKYVLNGSNWETENILPGSWGYNAMDGSHVIDIQRKHGERQLKNFPIMNLYKLKLYYPFVKKMKVIEPLNLLPYHKEDAIKELESNTNWRYYGGKHYESIWTRFFQSYYLPVKFNFDKRKAHLSSLIVSKQITRDEALKELEEKPYDDSKVSDEKKQIASKLGISIDELSALISSENRSHSEYYCTGNTFLYKQIFKIHKFLQR
ncbi:LPS biosynthesis protein WbpG [Sporosarcina sp. NCCP-2222]|uniref:N-acetyl sugar amidotransferase n=1 Tax=Sporosarcina sp. NCCP-2222 TaxID=2935073 RepID=UPI00208BB775|nr:N-acetyl sugar amidotransferase [Sporosarcina sp. NCCP-2222]GKV57402.1 LPS biosynthesis protein WbpG [Sporosarcina sp. NCCP-2222]